MQLDTVEVLPARPRARNERGYTTGELVDQLLGPADRLEAHACIQQVHRWRMSGAVVPSISEANGSGTKVLWSRGDLWRLRRIWEVRNMMRRYGMGISQALVSEIWVALYEGRTPPIDAQPELDAVAP